MINELLLKNNIDNELGLFTELFETIDYSTNDRVKDLIATGKSNALVCAESQKGGRGRSGRTWLSTDNCLAISFSIKPNVPITSFPMIAPLVAASIVDIFGDKAKIKWPNDLLIDNKKFSGILCELFTHEGVNYVIVGIGVNISLTNRGENEFENATSLLEEDINLSKEEIISRIYNSVISSLEIFEGEGFKPFARKYNERISYLGDEVVMLDSSVSGGDIEKAREVTSGILVGISDDAEIIIKNDKGATYISTGELSLRRKN